MKTFNKIGIIIAVLFGIILLFVSAKDNSTYKIDAKIIVDSIIEKSDQVIPADLNDWIISKSQTYKLIDIRTENEFENGSIPTAENIPTEELLKKETVSELPKDRAVILYSNGNSHAHQVWVILKGAGIKAFVLEGGYNYWAKYPTLPRKGISDDEILTYKKDFAAANSLKGIHSNDVTATSATPKKKKNIKKKKKKKKKNKLEGC